MSNSQSEVSTELAARDDPRLNEEFVRTQPATSDRHPAMLVGVVHDHPASSYRVREVATAFDPDVLGLELPAVAVPYFAGRGAESADGGDDAAATDEMTAAVAASPDAEAVGIDTLGWRFGYRFARNAVDERASPRTVGRAVGEIGHIARHALDCRLGAEGAHRDALAHDVTAADSPTAQADDERTRVARSRALLGAFERPHADLLLDGTREQTMAANVDARRRDGSVLAVVGIDHLDSVADGLT
ncbi:hypothetical protein KTS45_14265 [Halomicroarcula limicola]|uniref:Uncharacterized protein n=1 Tax=Haloarcula limicola TaxID=1429915 RepID=A0A8J7Y6W8_9EURY|nr:hypothetical protein [Halomicroarcula limicola]MBV0925367.1 hypothetical protein [Halomicroarcula limicola]